MITPEVSICCITYNHAKYIRDALDGFLMQKTTFPIEVLIHDDASTDGTADIIREYEERYPDIIKPIYQTENQYSKGVKIFLSIVPLAKGKYIAVCEGDDFWTDPKKLQIQYDFMERHPDYSMCFHNAEVITSDANTKSYFAHIEDRDYSGMELLETWTVPTASAFFRAKFACHIPVDKNFWCGDIIIWLTMSQYGKIKAIPERMSVYRQLSTGAIATLYVKKDRNWLTRQVCHNNAIEKHFPFISSQYIAKEIIRVHYLHLLYVRANMGKTACIQTFFKFGLLKQIQMVMYYISFRRKMKRNLKDNSTRDRH